MSERRCPKCHQKLKQSIVAAHILYCPKCLEQWDVEEVDKLKANKLNK